MFTPMVVQYLVGLCCARNDPNAVDVTVGDMVLDAAAGKRRDVDVTVTLKGSDGTVTAFKAYEVKREAPPLGVDVVEQLCAKLRDMPEVTHRAIVSTSGFTDGAIAKAAAHAVLLYEMKPWTAPLGDQFPAYAGVGPPSEFLRVGVSEVLCWRTSKLYVHCPAETPPFTFDDSTPLYARDGGRHKTFETVGDYKNALLLHSTSRMYDRLPYDLVRRTGPYQLESEDATYTVGPAWRADDTLYVAADEVHFKVAENLAHAQAVDISGELQWEKRNLDASFYILERVPEPEVFAGAAVIGWGAPEGKMSALLFAPDSRKINIHTFTLLEKHKHAIRRLQIPLPK